MNIKYMVTHCYKTDMDCETWDVLKVFDIVEEAIEYCEETLVPEGFVFIDVSWE